MEKIECFIISGISGSGKTTALKAFEDLGFYCIDNIPSILIPEAIKVILEKTNIKRIAISIDIRERVFLKESFYEIFRVIKERWNAKIIYLYADEKVIIKRYKETRRIHPLMEVDLKTALKKEKEILEPIKNEAEIFIDTTYFTIHDLKRFIYDNFSSNSENELKINIISFGFKNGILVEGDLIFDVRFIPNPFFVEELKDKNGNDIEVENFVLKFPQSKIFYRKLLELMEFLIPEYKKEGKSILIVGIGCTGGKHRSVVFANKLYNDLKNKYKVFLKHRDL